MGAVPECVNEVEPVVIVRRFVGESSQRVKIAISILMELDTVPPGRKVELAINRDFESPQNEKRPTGPLPIACWMTVTDTFIHTLLSEACFLDTPEEFGIGGWERTALKEVSSILCYNSFALVWG